MSNNVDVYNGDIISMLPGSQQDPPLYKSINGDGITDRNSAGEIQAIKLDMTKAGNTFIDLRPIFNANQSDGNIEMPIMPLMYGRQAPLDGFRGEIHGIYPDKKNTFDVDTALGNTGNIYRFLWPAGVFQATGKYVFTITFINDNTGEKITSKECFFEVEPNLLTMAVNFSEGISPFDSEYERWKAQVEKDISDFREQITTTQKTLSDIKGIAQKYESDVSDYADQAWANKLNGENTWTGKQNFNGGLTASNVESSNLNITGSASLPNVTTINNEFKLGNVLRLDKSVDGGSVSYLNATQTANSTKQSWLWGERYNKEMAKSSNPHFFLYMAFALDCSDVGKPFAQFHTGFFKGCNSGPITIPIGAGSAMFHVDETTDTLVLEGVSNLTGKVTVGTKIWI